jgi:hypothetical protein
VLCPMGYVRMLGYGPLAAGRSLEWSPAALSKATEAGDLLIYPSPIPPRRAMVRAGRATPLTCETGARASLSGGETYL